MTCVTLICFWLLLVASNIAAISRSFSKLTSVEEERGSAIDLPSQWENMYPGLGLAKMGTFPFA